MEKCYQFHIKNMSFSAENEIRLESDNKFISPVFLGYERAPDFSEEKPLWIKEDGTKAYYFHEELPTFDSSDEEYDSDHSFYLFRKNGMFEGLFVCFGYEVSEVYYYQNIVGENDAGKEFLQRVIAE